MFFGLINYCKKCVEVYNANGLSNTYSCPFVPKC